MENLDRIFDFIRPGVPMVAVFILGVLLLFGVKNFLNMRYDGQADKNLKQWEMK